MGKNEDVERNAQLVGGVKKSIIDRLKRIEGQARGIQKMVEDGRDCEEIMTQIAALKAAARQVGSMMLSSYLVECVRREVGQDTNIDAITDRFEKVLKKFL